MEDMTTFTSRSGKILAVVFILVFGGAAASTAATSGLVDGLRGIVITAFLALAIYATFWRPRLIIRESGVNVRNVVATHEIEWGAITRIDTKWGLTLFLGTKRINVWAAPAPSRYAAMVASRDQGQHLPESTYLAGTVRPGDLVTSDSGGAAALVRRHWERRGDDSARVETRVDIPLLVALIVLGAAAAAALVL
jgi:hypothetical protein